MAVVYEIDRFINDLAPFSTAMGFDNVGTLVGDKNAQVTKVLVALDVTKSVVEEAAAMGAELIISHHPVIFAPLKRLSADSIPYMLAAKGISVISAHTNYDFAAEGVNFCLAKALGLQNIEGFAPDKDSGLATGLVGELANEMEPTAFAAYVKAQLNCGGVKYTDGGHPVKKVAVGCGAASSLVFNAMGLGADAFVTGESKHHELLAAAEGGITMVDAGHFNTEDVSMEPLAEKLRAAFPGVEFVKSALKEPTLYL